MGKILIIDDDAFDSSIIERSLRAVSDDSQIEVVNDSREAATRFAQFEPDLTLLDVSMPRLDGFDVLEQISATARSANKSVVMLTGSTNPVDRNKAMHLGARDYKVKPSSVLDYQDLAEDLVNAYV